MSILSSQANDLRLMAKLVREYDYSEISRMLREAADTIISLRNRLDMTCKLEETEWVSMQCPMYRCSRCNGMFEDGRGDYRYCPYCGARVERRDA